MIKYLNENDNYGSFYRSNVIDDYAVKHGFFNFQKSCFNPVDMNNSQIKDQNNNIIFKAISNSLTDKPIYYAFNHSDDMYSDMGSIYNNKRIIEIYSYKKHCLTYIKFNLIKEYNESISPFAITLLGSDDKEVWYKIDKCNCGFSYHGDFSNKKCYFYSLNENRTNLDGSPEIICKFNNNNLFYYYRMVFQTEENIECNLKISDMFLYDNTQDKSPVFYFNFKENNNVNCILSNVYYDNEYPVVGGSVYREENVNNQSQIENQEDDITQWFQWSSDQNSSDSDQIIESLYNSSIQFPNIMLNSFKNVSLTFYAKLLRDNLIGTILSKSNEIFNLSVSIDQNNMCVFLIKINSLQKTILVDYNSLKNMWHHFCLTIGKKNDFYIDGQLIQQWNNVGLVFWEDSQVPFCIGCEPVENSGRINYIHAMQIKSFSVYDYIMTKKQIYQQIKLLS